MDYPEHRPSHSYISNTTFGGKSRFILEICYFCCNLDSINYRENPVLWKTIETTKIKDKTSQSWITGVAVLDNKLFVATGKSSEVKVYDDSNFRPGASLKLDGLRLVDPWDIVSCKRNHCLYILNIIRETTTTHEVLRVDPFGNMIKKWSSKKEWRRLSVTDESNLILIDYTMSRLDEYTSDGQFIRSINLSPKIVHPLHAIKLTSNNFVVSHGYYDDNPHRVCIVDDMGTVLKSFGELKKGLLNRPVRLAVDEDGSIIVADQENSRVLLLNSNLEFKRELIPKRMDGLKKPPSFYLDEINGRILVPDYSERVLIFNIK